MKKREIKRNLLNTKCFIDCTYLDLYCDLIISNLNTIKIITKTQRHHIIPVACYGPELNKKRKDLLSIANLDNNNFTINLLYKDHILAHYYLCMCANEFIFKKAFNGLSYLLKAESGNHKKKNKSQIEEMINEINLDHYQELYEKYHKIDYSQKIICIETQKIGTINSFSKQLNCYKGRLNACCNGINQTCRGYHWAYLNDLSQQEKYKNFIGCNPETFQELCRRKSQTMKNKKFSESHLQALRNRANKDSDWIYCKELNIKFESCFEALKYLRELNITKTTNSSFLNEALRNPNKKAWGYHWKRIKKNLEIIEEENK